MADKDYKAFIVEGEAREPQVIDNISKVFFKHGNFKIITLPAGENIYMLWKKLKADDFDTDIIEVLRESNKKIREQLEGLSRDDFSEVFLFFETRCLKALTMKLRMESYISVIRWLKHCEILKQVNAEMEIIAL